MSARICTPERPREWRRKVLVTVRIRSPSGWSDARIVDVSSRGMKIRSPQLGLPGSTIELRKGEQLILARIVWQQGGWAGLQSDSILPLGDLLCQGEEDGRPPVRSDELRAGPRQRSAQDGGLARNVGRLIDGFAVMAFATILVAALAFTAAKTLGDTMTAVRSALGPNRAA